MMARVELRNVSRRAVLGGGALAVGAPWLLAGSTQDKERTRAAQVAALSAPPPPAAVLAALDLDAATAAEVAQALREIRGRLAGIDSSVETVIGYGASLFDRPGMDERPRQLTAMPTFDGDVLDPGRCHGDLLLTVGADSATAAEAVVRAVTDGMTVRWTQSGFRAGNRVEAGRGLSENLFGFTEGHGNPYGRRLPDTVEVRAGTGEPEWAVGGTYQVVRVIRFATELWDADPVDVQERIIGRRRDGRWLDGTRPGAERPATDIPHESHVGLAKSGPAEMLRRGYGYRGSGPTGRPEEGLVFVAFQRDLERGFAGVQRRLAGEHLGRYTLTVGGGYFYVPV